MVNTAQDSDSDEDSVTTFTTMPDLVEGSQTLTIEDDPDVVPLLTQRLYSSSSDSDESQGPDWVKKQGTLVDRGANGGVIGGGSVHVLAIPQIVVYYE